MSFDPHQRAIRPNEILERKLDATNELLARLIEEVRELRASIAPPAEEPEQSADATQEWIDSMKASDDGMSRYKDLDR